MVELARQRIQHNGRIWKERKREKCGKIMVSVTIIRRLLALFFSLISSIHFDLEMNSMEIFFGWAVERIVETKKV